MKATTSILSLFLIVLLTACNTGTGINIGSDSIIKGNGNVITESRDATKDFSKLTAKGSVNVFLKKGDTQKIEVEAEDNILPNVSIEIKNGELTARTEGSIRTKKGINIYVVYKELNAITSSGSTDVFVESLLKSKSISLVSSGSSDINIDSIEAENIDLTSSGSSDIKIKHTQTKDFILGLSGSSDVKIAKGTATNLTISTSGSSDLYADNLETKTAAITSSGSSDVRVRVSNKLTAQSSGASDINYYGNPENVTESKTGSSTINKK